MANAANPIRARTLDFPLGRRLVPATSIRRQRLLPVGATSVVAMGDQVQPDQAIAEIASGGNHILMQAGFSGRVTDVILDQRISIEGTVTIIQGVVGIGGPATGTLCVLPRGESLAMVAIPRAGVLLFPQQLPLVLMQRAASGGAAGIIAGSASAREIEAFSRLDLGAALDGFPPAAPPSPLTIVLTEGLGDMAMSAALYHVLSSRLSSTVYLSGETSVIQAIRPEILLSPSISSSVQPLPLNSMLEPGAIVTIWAGERHGAQGQVLQVLAHQQYNAAGLLVPSAIVRFEDGVTAVMPLHILDRIG